MAKKSAIPDKGKWTTINVSRESAARFNELRDMRGMSQPDFLIWLLDNAPRPIRGDDPTELWGRFNVVIMPMLTELGTALGNLGKSINVEASADKGFIIIRQVSDSQ